MLNHGLNHGLVGDNETCRGQCSANSATCTHLTQSIKLKPIVIRCYTHFCGLVPKIQQLSVMIFQPIYMWVCVPVKTGDYSY